MFRDFKNPLYKKWRTEVYKRDHYTCQWPGCSTKKRLNAHHIRTWSNFEALRFSVPNGITLCYQHHKMIKGQEHIYESAFFRILANQKTP